MEKIRKKLDKRSTTSNIVVSQNIKKIERYKEVNETFYLQQIF